MARDCPWILDAMLDLEHLPESERQVVEAHLAGCAACQREYELMKDVDDAFSVLLPNEIPDGFADGVIAAVQARRDSAYGLGPGMLYALAASAAAAGALTLWHSNLMTQWTAGATAGLTAAHGILTAVMTGLLTVLQALGSDLVSLPAAVPAEGWQWIVTALLLGLGFGALTLHEGRPEHG